LKQGYSDLIEYGNNYNQNQNKDKVSGTF